MGTLQGVTLEDFGAVQGTNASGALQSALQYAVANSVMVRGQGRKYFLDSPVNVNINQIVASPFGFDGQGDVFTARFSGGAPAIQFNITALNRYLTLSNMMLYGQGRVSGGIRLEAQFGGGNGTYLCNFNDVCVENVVGPGIHLYGDIFETTIFRPRCTDCTGAGIRFEHHPNGGVLSSITVIGPQCQQNDIGIELQNNCRDVTVFGGYCRDNQRWGAYFSNGMAKVWYGVGFENNWRSVSPGAGGNLAHVDSQNNGLFDNCWTYDQIGGAKYGFRLPWNIGDSVVRSCSRGADGSAAAAGVAGVFIGGGSNPDARIYMAQNGGMSIEQDGSFQGELIIEGNKIPQILTRTTSHTLGANDADKIIRMDNTSAAIVTIPAHASVPFLRGSNITIRQVNNGSVSIAGAGGVTLNAADTLTLRKRNSTVMLMKVADNVWDLAGDFA